MRTRRPYIEEGLIRYAIGTKKGWAYASLYEVARYLASDIIESLRKLRCPICGREFDSKQRLVKHLSRGRCKQAILSVLSTVVSEYIEASKRIAVKRGRYVTSDGMEFSERAKAVLHEVMRRWRRKTSTS